MDFDQMKFRCPGAEYLGVATLPNYELKMDAAGFATVIPAPGKHVQEALIYLSLRGPFYDWSFREDYVTKVRNGAAGIGVDAHTLNQLQNIQIIPNAHVA